MHWPKFGYPWQEWPIICNQTEPPPPLTSIACLQQIKFADELAGDFGAQLSPAHSAENFGSFGLQGRKPEIAFYRSEEHTSELQSLMGISYAVFCLKKKNTYNTQ